MPAILRPRLKCHYCGKTSKKAQGARKFQCEGCLAVNFLEENGEIADVPIDEVAASRSSFRLVNSEPAPQSASSNLPIFCQTCINNQNFLTQALSNYLPEIDDPSYTLCELNLPKYRKDLEDRFPQVCAKCEPRVRVQLQKATNVAKSDHVRRMLDRSRARRIASRWGWRSLLLSLAALGFYGSVTGQVFWHLTGIFADSTPTVRNTRSRPTDCLKCVIGEPVSRMCVESTAPIAGAALLLGLACIWWNPKWQHKVAGNEGRLKGLHNYYRSQVLVLIVRFLSWTMLREAEAAGLGEQPQRAAHSLFVIFELILTAWTFFLIEVDTSPLVSVDWQTPLPPLISADQFVPPTALPDHSSSRPPSQRAAPDVRISSTASFGSGSGHESVPWRPPTPPAEDPNAMEWEPSSQEFQPKPKKPRQKYTGPSPFHGAIPAMPRTGLYSQSVKQAPNKEAIGIPPGFFDKPRSSNTQLPQSTPYAAIAEARFFPQQDRQADTGLEKMFDSIFSMEKTSARPDATAQTIAQPDGTFHPVPAYSETSTWSFIDFASLLFLSATIIIWLVSDYAFELLSTNTKNAVTTITVLLAFQHVFLNQSSLRFSDRARYLGFSCMLVGSGLYRWLYYCDRAGFCDSVTVGIMGGILAAELGDFFASSAPTTPAASHQESTSSHLTASPSTPSQVTQSTIWGDLPSRIEVNESSLPPELSYSFPRPRKDSSESLSSTMSLASTTTSTATGWKTPKTSQARFGQISSHSQQSPGFGLGGLALDDRRPPATFGNTPTLRSRRPGLG